MEERMGKKKILKSNHHEGRREALVNRKENRTEDRKIRRRQLWQHVDIKRQKANSELRRQKTFSQTLNCSNAILCQLFEVPSLHYQDLTYRPERK